MASVDLTITAPITETKYGGLRVTGTRIGIELIIEAYQAGHPVSEILDWWPSLTEADVFGVLAHYAQHREAIDAYIAEGDRKAAESQREFDRLCEENPKMKAAVERVRAAKQQRTASAE